MPCQHHACTTVSRKHFSTTTKKKKKEVESFNIAKKRFTEEEININKAKDLEREAAAALSKNEFVAAEKCLEGALTIRTMYLTGSSPGLEKDLAELYNLYAYTLHSMGKRIVAREYYMKARPLIEKTFGKKSYKLGECLLNTAELHALMGEFSEAEATCRECIDILRAEYKQPNEYLAGALANLASYIAMQERPKEAVPLCKEALGIFDKILGPQNDYTLNCLRNYLRLLRDLDLREEFEVESAIWRGKAESVFNEPAPPTTADLDALFRNTDSLKEQEFDPEGAMKSPEFARQQLKEYLKWKTSQEGGGLSGDLTPALQEEVDRLQEWQMANELPSQNVPEHARTAQMAEYNLEDIFRQDEQEED